MIYSKPNYTLGTWASNGNVFSPTSEKIELGHTTEKPKSEVMNWIQNRQDVGIAYILQNGIAEWDSSTEFPVNAYIKYNGVVYRSISQNIDAQPDVSSGIWSLAFTSHTDYLNLVDEVNKIKTIDGYLPSYVRISAPTMANRCWGTSYTANIGLNPSGNDNSGFVFNGQLNDGLFHNGDTTVIQKNGDVVAIFEPPLSTTENTKRVVTMDVLKELLQTYKIGDLYLTTGTENPAVRLGYGTWSRYAQGKAIVGVADSSASTPAWTKFSQSEFGEYDHTLSVQELPKFSVPIPYSLNVTGQGSLAGNYNGNSGTTQSGQVGGDLPHNNVQPSITVNIWLRTG